MMKLTSKIKLFVLILITGIFSFYLYSYPYKSIQIEDRINQINNGEELPLSLLNNSDWDSVVLIAPYNVDGIKNIYMSNKYKRIIEADVNNDSYCTLLFIKHNKLVNYSSIKRSSRTDLSKYNNMYFDKNSKLSIDSAGIVHFMR